MGVDAVGASESLGERVGALGDGDEVDVVRQEAVAEQGDAVNGAFAAQGIEVEAAVVVGAGDVLAVVAALGDVVGNARCDETGFSGHAPSLTQMLIRGLSPISPISPISPAQPAQPRWSPLTKMASLTTPDCRLRLTIYIPIGLSWSTVNRVGTSPQTRFFSVYNAYMPRGARTVNFLYPGHFGMPPRTGYLVQAKGRIGLLVLDGRHSGLEVLDLQNGIAEKPLAEGKLKPTLKRPIDSIPEHTVGMEERIQERHVNRLSLEAAPIGVNPGTLDRPPFDPKTVGPLISTVLRKGEEIPPQQEMLVKAIERLKSGRDYDHSLLLAFFSIEQIITELLDETKQRRGVSKARINDSRHVGISYLINVELFLVLPQNHPIWALVPRLNEVNTVRNGIVHKSRHATYDEAFRAIQVGQELTRNL